jgi:hypothetical protein
MRLRSILLLLLCAANGALLQAGGDVKGAWFDDPADALAAAAKKRKPVLAVAMDHG